MIRMRRESRRSRFILPFNDWKATVPTCKTLRKTPETTRTRTGSLSRAKEWLQEKSVATSLVRYYRINVKSSHLIWFAPGSLTVLVLHDIHTRTTTIKSTGCCAISSSVHTFFFFLSCSFSFSCSCLLLFNVCARAARVCMCACANRFQWTFFGDPVAKKRFLSYFHCGFVRRLRLFGIISFVRWLCMYPFWYDRLSLCMLYIFQCAMVNHSMREMKSSLFAGQKTVGLLCPV